MPTTALPKLELPWYGILLHGPTADKPPSVGPLALAWKRFLERWDPAMFAGQLRDIDDVFNLRTVHGTKIVQRAWKQPVTGRLTKATFERSLRAVLGGGTDHPQPELCWDMFSRKLWQQGKPRVPLARCYCYPKGVASRAGGGVADHMRRPLGNWQSDNAIDEHAPAGAPFVSPKAGYVSKGGGHDPHQGPVATIFGEHTTVECDDGTAFFVTHLDRIVSVGERVVVGELIGFVGDWPGSTAMDHGHLGARGFNPEQIRKWPRVTLPTRD